jgi:hypothetical protein
MMREMSRRALEAGVRTTTRDARSRAEDGARISDRADAGKSLGSAAAGRSSGRVRCREDGRRDSMWRRDSRWRPWEAFDPGGAGGPARRGRRRGRRPGGAGEPGRREGVVAGQGELSGGYGVGEEREKKMWLRYQVGMEIPNPNSELGVVLVDQVMLGLVHYTGV